MNLMELLKIIFKLSGLLNQNKLHYKKIYKQFWYIKNKQKVRKKQKEYLKENKKKVYTSRLKYYLKNRSEILRKTKEKYARKKMQKM